MKSGALASLTSSRLVSAGEDEDARQPVVAAERDVGVEPVADDRRPRGRHAEAARDHLRRFLVRLAEITGCTPVEAVISAQMAPLSGMKPVSVGS